MPVAVGLGIQGRQRTRIFGNHTEAGALLADGDFTALAIGDPAVVDGVRNAGRGRRRRPEFAVEFQPPSAGAGEQAPGAAAGDILGLASELAGHSLGVFEARA